MADRRRWAGLAIVVAMSLGSGAELACGEGEGRPPAWKEPRDAEIRETLDAVWAAVGLRPEQVSVAEYAYTFAPDNTACAALESDDRWFGERGSSAVAEGRGQAEIEDAIVGYLEGEGFEVQRYRSTHPDSRARSLQGVKGDLVVYASPDPGYASVNVRSGPCAAAFSRFDSDLFEPDV